MEGFSDTQEGMHSAVSAGADATSHFETLMEDVLDMYRRITGKPLDLEKYDAAQATTDAE